MSAYNWHDVEDQTFIERDYDQPEAVTLAIIRMVSKLCQVEEKRWPDFDARIDCVLSDHETREILLQIWPLVITEMQKDQDYGLRMIQGGAPLCEHIEKVFDTMVDVLSRG